MNSLLETITAHLKESPKNEIVLSSGSIVFVKSATLVSIAAEADAMRINGIRYFASQVQ